MCGEIHSSLPGLTSLRIQADVSCLGRGIRVVNTGDEETLLDLHFRRLECFKHFFLFLFEAECIQNATRVRIERRDRTDWNQRPPVAMVG